MRDFSPVRRGLGAARYLRSAERRTEGRSRPATDHQEITAISFFFFYESGGTKVAKWKPKK